ncbi:MAG: hypothetical protein WD512_03295 [Candidatus Paceibacterota bacterium]
MLEELPLLIREKVEYYCNRQVWLNKIKLMHKEYMNQVKVFENPIYPESLFFNNVSWKIKNSRDDFFYVCDLSSSGRIYHNKPSIYRFVDASSTGNKMVVAANELSKYFYYSSGLNNPTGYK